MVVNVAAAVKHPGVAVPFHLLETAETMENAGEHLRFQEPIAISGEVLSTGEDILVRGTVHVSYLAACARCLTDVPVSLDISFEEEYAKTADDNHPDRYLYQGETLTLDQMVNDLIALQTPTRHLCNPNCRGLCPVCGADRNKETCNCRGADPDGESPFAAD